MDKNTHADTETYRIYFSKKKKRKKRKKNIV